MDHASYLKIDPVWFIQLNQNNVKISQIIGDLKVGDRFVTPFQGKLIIKSTQLQKDILDR